MQLFYNSEIRPDSTSLVLDKEESRHVMRVLRKKEGDSLHITDGKGHLYTARIISADPKKCSLEVIECARSTRTRDYHLHVAIAPTKMNDRFEWFLEKATEIGIDEITPLVCEHSERKTIKSERMQKIITSAMKQSLKTELPLLHPLSTFDHILKDEGYDRRLIAHCEEGPKTEIRDLAAQDRKILVLIGPEGDFSPGEIQRATASGFEGLNLGASRLRTETAGVVVSAQLSMVKEFS